MIFCQIFEDSPCASDSRSLTEASCSFVVGILGKKSGNFSNERQQFGGVIQVSGQEGLVRVRSGDDLVFFMGISTKAGSLVSWCISPRRALYCAGGAGRSGQSVV